MVRARGVVEVVLPAHLTADDVNIVNCCNFLLRSHRTRRIISHERVVSTYILYTYSYCKY